MSENEASIESLTLGQGPSQHESVAQDRHETLNKLFPSRKGSLIEAAWKTRLSPTGNMSPTRRSFGRKSSSSVSPDEPTNNTIRRRSSASISIVKDAVWRWDIVHPHGKFRYYWDMTTLLFMLWVVIDVPFMVAFDVAIDVNVWDWHRIISLMVDVFFMLDVILNFNTGVEIGGIVSMDRIVIAKDYLKSWFWIDIVSAFPLDLVLQGSAGSNSANSTQVVKLAKMGRVVRMFKLIRLLRIARVMRVVSRLEYTMSTQEAMRTLWKFFAVVVICCHLFSCAFYAIGVAYNGPDEWANGVDESVNTLFAKYVACFYWAIMTTTTIGYGDVSSLGTAQQLFGMLAMLIGALLFGYGVSNVVNIVEELRSGERIFREKMDKFNRYMRSQNFPSELQDSIRDYLKNVKRVHAERVSVEDEIGLLSQLSLGLRERIAVAVNDIYLRDMPFFAGEDPSVVMELAFCMERCCVGPEEDVIRAGDIGHEMYFILEGKVEILATPKSGGVMRPIAIFGEGQFFGEMALLEPKHIRTATAKTITFCEFRLLSAAAFNVIATRYPMFGRNLQTIVGERSSFLDDSPYKPRNLSVESDMTFSQNSNNEVNADSPSSISNSDGKVTPTPLDSPGVSFDEQPLSKFGGRPMNTLPPFETTSVQPSAIELKPLPALPGPLLSPLSDTFPASSSAGGRRKSIGEHPQTTHSDTTLQTIFTLVSSLHEQQQDFSKTVLTRINALDNEVSTLKEKVRVANGEHNYIGKDEEEKNNHPSLFFPIVPSTSSGHQIEELKFAPEGEKVPLATRTKSNNFLGEDSS